MAAGTLAATAGAAVWLVPGHVTNHAEAWDSHLHFSILLPVLALVAGVLGYLAPERPWRWGALPLANG